jgi:hypothetical protein
MIVTSFYDIYNNPDKLKYYTDLFQDITKSGLPIVLFTDPSLLYLFNDLPNNVHIYAISLTEFQLYSIAMSYSGELPINRNHPKDTREFLALMNTKIEFIWRAMTDLPRDDTYIWVDFGILKIIKDRDVFINKLRIANERTFDKIIIPGCWNYGCSVNYDNVNWRFCGGIIIIPFSKVEPFFEKNKTCLLEACTTSNRKLTWETNIWYLIELGGERDNIEWYAGDHNDSIMRDFSQ